TRYEEDVLLDRESPTLLGDEDRPHPAAVPAQEEVDGVERAAVGPFPDRLFDLSVELLQLVRLRDGDDERQVAGADVLEHAAGEVHLLGLVVERGEGGGEQE